MNTCWYTVKDAAGRHQCGAPATHRNFTGVQWFYLCEPHARKVQTDTGGKCRPTPLVETPPAAPAKPPARLTRASPRAKTRVIPPAAASYLEQLRRFRDHLAAQSDNGSL